MIIILIPIMIILLLPALTVITSFAKQHRKHELHVHRFRPTNPTKYAYHHDQSSFLPSIIYQQQIPVPLRLDLPTSMVDSRHTVYYPLEILDESTATMDHGDDETSNDQDPGTGDDRYGGLNLRFLMEAHASRYAYKDMDSRKGVLVPHEPVDDYYFAWDDDIARNPNTDEWALDEGHCRRHSWHRHRRLNCNTFHELDTVTLLQEQDFRFLGQGAYRQVYRVIHDHPDTDDPEDSWEKSVLKTFRWVGEGGGVETYGPIDYEYMRIDAMVAETFSSNERFVDIYGYCGISMLAEYMNNGDLEAQAMPFYSRSEKNYQDWDEAQRLHLNSLYPQEKLRIALEMAEAVACLHNHPDGAIVHNDIQLAQFLMTTDGTTTENTKYLTAFNDFNRAEILMFDEEHERYCRYRNGPGNGDWRSPEEYFDEQLTLQIDIWSLGMNFYALLTGTGPFPDRSVLEVQRLVMDKQLPEVDPRITDRSFEEGILYKIMEKCLVYDPSERIDISTLVLLLRGAWEESHKRLSVPEHET